MYFVQLRIAKVKTTFCLCENSTLVHTMYTTLFALLAVTIVVRLQSLRKQLNNG